ncbi:MAG: tRNA (adenosine(37)-N6)-threonylcarbamoyltransferase complex dimerization subunit type 1 TsaB [Planctomycetota bacterium]
MPTHPETFELALETSGVISGVAVGQGGTLLGEKSFDLPRAHAAGLVALIDELCRHHRIRPRDIGNVYVSQGPGSFTGLRIGMAAARMMALANQASLTPVPTLQGIALQAADLDDPPEQVTVMLDAKRGHVYASLFDFDQAAKLYRCIREPEEVEPLTFLNNCSRRPAVMGEGLQKHGEAVRGLGLRVLPESTYLPRAASIYRLGAELADRGISVSARELIPAYIRRPEAEERWKARQRE